MKKFLVRVAIFVLFAFVLQLVLYKSIKTVLDTRSQFRWSRYFRHKKHRYYVLGNSRAVNSINEKYANDSLKKDIINLGYNGQPYVNVYNMLQDVNSSTANSTIYVEVTALLNNEVENSICYYISNSAYIKQQFAGTAFNNIHALRLDNELLLRNIYYLRHSDNEWINTKSVSQQIVDAVKDGKPLRLILNKPEFIHRLGAMQTVCNRHHNKLVYFLAPYLPQYLRKIPDYGQLLYIMNDKNHNYNFINLNTEHLKQSMFADRIHTNIEGSLVLTTRLLSYPVK